MVQLTPSRLQGAINIESVLEVNEGFVQRLKCHESKAQALEKDLHVQHILSTDENGNIISKVGKMYDNERDAVEQLTIVQRAHEKFIHTVEQWELSKNPANEEQPKEADRNLKILTALERRLKEDNLHETIGIVRVCKSNDDSLVLEGYMINPLTVLHYLEDEHIKHVFLGLAIN